MRYRAALALLIAVLCQALAAWADGPGPPGVATPAPTPSATASAAPQPADAQWSVNRTAIGLVLDELTTKMFGIFQKFTDKSVQLAQTLFMALASLEFGWTAIRWMVSQVPLEEYVANSFFKAVQMGLLFMVISNSYSSPFGPGWFMMVVNGIVGMAQDTAGFAVIGTSNTGQFTPIITPGTIVDIGLRLFTLIMSAASSGVNGWNLLSGLTNGATLIYFGTWCFCLVSACGAVFTMAWIGFRWLWITMKALWLGVTMFMTGFTGSRVTSSIGYGPFNGAFNVGIEMAAHVVIIGLFYPIITSYAGSIGFSEALQGVPFYAGPGASVPTPAGPMVIQIGAVLLLDLGLALWTYAIKHAPDLAQFAVSGAIRLNERDAFEGGKAESAVMQSGAAVARLGGGAVAAFSGGAGAEGERQPSAGDRLKGAFSGALRGGMMAGPEGALGGAVVGAATAKPSAPSGQDQGSIRGGSGGAAGAAPGAGAAGAFTGGFVDVRAGKGPAGGTVARGGSAGGAAATGDAHPNSVTPEASPAAAMAPEAGRGGSEAAGGRGNRTVGAQAGAEPPADGIPASAAAGSSSGPGGATGAPTSAHGAGGSAWPRPAPGARVVEGAAASTAARGAGAAAAGAQRVPQAGGTQATAAPSDPGAAGPPDAGAALRGHGFGSAGSAGSAGSGVPSGGAAPGGAALSSGPLGALLGDGNPMNPINMMLYRQLLTAGQRRKPTITNERPAVSLGVSHIE